LAMDETPGSATERQISYIAGLSDKKDLRDTRLNEDQRAFLVDGSRLNQLSKAQASKVIELLLSLNDKPVEPAIPAVELVPSTQDLVDHDAERFPDTPVQGLKTESRKNGPNMDKGLADQVKAGYYFIVDPTNDEERFFHVSKGKEGSRWEGYTFLDVRGGDFLYKIKDPAHREAVYKEILKDPVTAMNEYGIRLGVCGNCGRTLTARDSRLRGIGPICAAQLMMEDSQATDDQLDMLRQLGIKKD